MAHTSETRWGAAAAKVSAGAQTLLDSLNASEQVYQELLEGYQYAGGTDQDFANLLFKDAIDLDDTRTVATAEEVALVADLRAAIETLHELYQVAAGEISAVQIDRFAAIRRMS